MSSGSRLILIIFIAFRPSNIYIYTLIVKYLKIVHIRIYVQKYPNYNSHKKKIWKILSLPLVLILVQKSSSSGYKVSFKNILSTTGMGPFSKVVVVSMFRYNIDIASGQFKKYQWNFPTVQY